MRVGSTEPRITLPGASAAAATPAAATVTAAAPPATRERSPFAKMLQDLGREITAGESTMRHAASAPKDLGPAELIALQAGVYRYSEALDLASRLVDHATSGVKTVMQAGGQ